MRWHLIRGSAATYRAPTPASEAAHRGPAPGGVTAVVRASTKPFVGHHPSIVVAFALTAASLSAQNFGDLAERCFASLHGQNTPPARRNVLSPPLEPEPDGRVVIGRRKPGEIQQHACPLCKQALVQVDLWQGKPGIDSQDLVTAHVCEQHALFFVTNDGVMSTWAAGPFALPANAKDKPVRPFLPYGALLADDEEPWPGSKWHSVDGRLYLGDGNGPFHVRNSERVLYREPKGDDNGMGIVSHAFSGESGLCAYAHSMGPLVVGELGTGKRRALVSLRADNVTAIAIHPAGTHVVFVVLEGGHQQSSLRVLDIASGKVRELTREPAAVPAFFAFPSPTTVVAAAWDGTVASFSLTSGRREWERSIDAGKAAYRVLSAAPDGRRVLFCSRGGLLASLLDARTGATDSELVVHSPVGDARTGGPVSVAWSADCTKFAWSYGHGQLARSDVAVPGEVKRHFGAAELLGLDGTTPQLRFTIEGNAVQSRDRDGHQMRWPLDAFDAPW